MLKALTRDTSNKRFIAYVTLFYIIAVTAGAWVPVTSPAFEYAKYIKLLLVPLAQTILMQGARYRWPDHYFLIGIVACAFFAGLILSTISFGIS